MPVKTKSAATKSGTRKQSSQPKLSEVAKHLVIPDGIVSTGWPAVRDRCRQFGVRFDRWQDGWGRLMLAKDKNGIYTSAIGGVTASIPRQIGKTFTMGAIAFALCINEPNHKVLWTAHMVDTATETFHSMVGMTKMKGIAPHVSKVRNSGDKTSIEFKNGSEIQFGSRERGFARGKSLVSFIVFDEAQILKDRAMEDMAPASSAVENALVVKIGTPPKPGDASEVFKRSRRAALSGASKNALYIEFGADDGASPNDWKQIGKANPSYLIGRTSKTAILRTRENLSEESFLREMMGIWDEEHSALKAFDFEHWKRGYIAKSKVPQKGRQCFAVRFSVDGSSVALAAARRPDNGPVYVEGVKIASMGEGTQWLVDWLLERRNRAAQIVIDGKYGAGYLVNALRDGGVKNKRVIITPSVPQVIEAHATFDQAVKQGEFSTIQQEDVEAEVLGAERRLIGKDGGFGWAAPDGGSVVLVDAMTYAFWAAKTTKRNPEGSGGVTIL